MRYSGSFGGFILQCLLSLSIGGHKRTHVRSDGLPDLQEPSKE